MDELRVDLAAFHGPLDLLLYLVQQEEVDVFDVPIARIADRFLDACRRDVHKLDVDRAGEFLVMASQLLVLKSRALLPREEAIELEEIDPRLDLVRQLLEYRDFKTLSGELASRLDAQRQKMPVRVRRPAAPPAESLLDDELELDLYGLVAAFQRLLRETGDEERVAMAKERLPITHFVGQIFDRLTELGGRIRFRDLFQGTRDRTYVIGAFLALLELVKLRRVRATQDGLGEIHLEIRESTGEQDVGDNEEANAEALDRPMLEAAPTGPRIVLMGSPEFAVPSLQALCGAGLTPKLVVTPPPQRAGRGRRWKQVPLAVAAQQLQLPLHRTNDINGRVSFREVEMAAPDVIVTVGFGQKLKKKVLSLPRMGCVNLHASLLPAYRGASPVAAALRAGETEVGVTIFRMDSKMDHGPMLAKRGTRVANDATRDDVRAQLAVIGADLLAHTLPTYLDDELLPEEQDHSLSSYAPRLEKHDGVVPWSASAPQVHNAIRSVTAWPGAQSAWQPRVRHEPLGVVITKSRVLADDEWTAPTETSDGISSGPLVPGTVIAVAKDGIDVACGEGAVRLLALKPAGGRSMTVQSFLNGRRVAMGDRFVAPPKNAPKPVGSRSATSKRGSR